MQMFPGKSLFVSALALGAAVVVPNANADQDDADTLRWESIIGIAQPNNVVGSGAGAVNGGGLPWSALDGRVNVHPDGGRIDFRVHGLALAAGNAVGTPGAVSQVKGTLVCDTDGSASGGNSVLVDTPLVDLGDAGDAHFNGSVGALPSVCQTEPDIAFLIRVGSGRWIANGTVPR
jgi:hypothetical protein